METQDTPKDNAVVETPPLSKREELGMTVFLSLPVVCWCLLCTYWLTSGLHLLLALPLGCLIGVVVYFLVGQMFNSGTNNLMELNIGSSIGLVMALILTPVFAQAREKARATNCLQSVKAASVAFLMYAQDNDGSLPPGADWETAVRPYVPSPSDNEESDDEERKEKETPKKPLEIQCPLAPSGSGYALSQSLAGQSLETVAEPEATPLVFDANVVGRNAIATIERLPQPGRHRGGNVIGYADGHVHLQKMQPLPAAPPKFYVQAGVLRVVSSRR